MARSRGGWWIGGFLDRYKMEVCNDLVGIDLSSCARGLSFGAKYPFSLPGTKYQRSGCTIRYARAISFLLAPRPSGKRRGVARHWVVFVCVHVCVCVSVGVAVRAAACSLPDAEIGPQHPLFARGDFPPLVLLISGTCVSLRFLGPCTAGEVGKEKISGRGEEGSLMSARVGGQGGTGGWGQSEKVAEVRPQLCGRGWPVSRHEKEKK